MEHWRHCDSYNTKFTSQQHVPWYGSHRSRHAGTQPELHHEVRSDCTCKFASGYSDNRKRRPELDTMEICSFALKNQSKNFLCAHILKMGCHSMTLFVIEYLSNAHEYLSGSHLTRKIYSTIALPRESVPSNAIFAFLVQIDQVRRRWFDVRILLIANHTTSRIDILCQACPCHVFRGESDRLFRCAGNS